MPADIERVESAIGFRVPETLRKILSAHDGGSLEVGAFDFGDGETTAISDFLTFSDADSTDSVLFVRRNHADLPHGVVPFARDAGDWLVCLDYSLGDAARIVLFKPETGQLAHVADSFDDFINALYA